MEIPAASTSTGSYRTAAEPVARACRMVESSEEAAEPVPGTAVAG